MTQEEKAIRYDEALERAKNLHKDAIDMGEDIRAKQCEIIFPELKESEDDKIRRIVYGWINTQPSSFFDLNEISKEDMLAWLEKQGQKDKLIQELGEYKVKYTQETLEKALTMNNKDNERLRNTTIAFLKEFADKGYENAIECIDWLEKQGKKPQEAIKWADKTMIEKACKWLKLNTNWDDEWDEMGRNMDYGKIEEFRKAMEE